ncbi:MAG: NADP-dependent malic enzyme, partial [Bdellovibrionales bacterium]|nr:NADP-dependent malic enzyme [Bdellovibrionales bacterium]
GKAVLFKTFADIDVFDLELRCATTEQFIETVASLAPTFGGINLEDIAAPQCFAIEEALRARLDIPVFHDDQHGTAIIASAALLNALELTDRDISRIRLVISGAGAAAIACVRLLYQLGLRPENLLMVDSKGVLYEGRAEGMNPFKQEFVRPTSARTLADALRGADVFFGLSGKDLMTPEMLLSMADSPIVFAMANPDPEIDYELATRTRADVIMATGRSDFPNQVNNVLGFPFIFRGALDVRARGINEEMKLAAVRALARLAKEPVPDTVKAAYGRTHFAFGPEYLIPKPFDPRVLYYVAPAVAEAAMRCGLARETIDLEEYTLRLKSKQNRGRRVLRGYYALARKSQHKRVAFAEGTNHKVLTAAQMAAEEGLARPVLLGDATAIREQAARMEISLDAMDVVDPATDARYDHFVRRYYELRNRKGVTESEAKHAILEPHRFANMMLVAGEVDAVLCGVDKYYTDMVRPIFEIVGLRPGYEDSAGLYVAAVQGRILFLADTTINTEMTARRLANVAKMTAEFAQSMDVPPRVAMLSFSNFGSLRHSSASMVREAVELVRAEAPGLEIDGEMQADSAVVPEILSENYSFSTLSGAANVLIFPDMQSGNISYKLLQRLGGARVVGPIILGLNAPAYVLQRHAGVDEIFNMTTVAVAQATLRAQESAHLMAASG